MRLNLHIYRHTFYPLIPSINLLAGKRVDFGSQLSIVLQVNTQYVLVMTAVAPDETGSYSIEAMGPDRISVQKLSKFKHESIVDSRHAN